MLSKRECIQFPSLCEFLAGKGAPCDGKSKIRCIKLTQNRQPEFPDFDEKILTSGTSQTDDQVPQTADILIIEKADARTLGLLLANKVSQTNRLSFLKFLETYLHDQPSFNFANVRHQLASMPSVVTKQQHVAFTYVTAREFDRPFILGYGQVQMAGRRGGSWRIERTWGPMNPVQRTDTGGVSSAFCPLAVTRTQAAAWFNRDADNAWNLGVVLLDEPPRFTGLPGFLNPPYHVIHGDWYVDSVSPSDLLVNCMKNNTNLQAAGIPGAMAVVQNLYRIVTFEWNLLITYYTRDLNSIEWALQHGDGNHKSTSEMLRDAMRNLFLSRRRIPWYRTLLREQLASCQPKGRRFWSLADKSTPEEDAIADELADDLRQLEYLMAQIHERLDASMTHIVGETNVLEAQRTHELNQITVQQNRIAFAQNKILLALALVGTFFLPINAIAAVFSMGGQWAAGEAMFPVFWAISIPLALGLVSALLVFMYYGNRGADRVRLTWLDGCT